MRSHPYAYSYPSRSPVIPPGGFSILPPFLSSLLLSPFVNVSFHVEYRIAFGERGVAWRVGACVASGDEVR